MTDLVEALVEGVEEGVILVPRGDPRHMTSLLKFRLNLHLNLESVISDFSGI